MSERISEVHNEDCMIGMARYPDKWFDLAVVDPPYGIGEDGSKKRTTPRRPNSYSNWSKHQKKDWDKQPESEEYFNEMFRVSKNQIVWGANHFISRINKDSSCWIVWDKNMGGDFADCELAWTSFSSAIRKFFGHPFIGTNGGKDRIHPTQKPVALYDWIYKNYLPQGGKVIDTHLGSGSNRIAANKAGNIDFVGFELDKDYYEAQEKRWKGFISQTRLFG